MMPVEPPPGCLDPRLWTTGYELARQHADDDGRCVVCAIPAPCPRYDAAMDAMRRALPPPPPTVYEIPAEPEPEPRAPVGARFPSDRHIGRRRRPG